MSFQAYTCGFMIDRHGNTILVEKLKPAWQAGKLNGIGGKIEINETPHACMRREWREETGDDHADWDHVCSLQFPECEVYFFRAIVDHLPAFWMQNDVGEYLSVWNAAGLPAKVIDNLRWLIPLCMDRNGNIGGKIFEAKCA